MGINRVQLFGNLGADPELRYTPGQVAVCKLRIATTERRKGADGQWSDHTEWHRVTVFGKTAENCGQYLAKGRKVFIEGKLQTSKWQDQSGQDRYSTDIIAQTVEFIGGGKGEGGSAGRSSGPDFSNEDMPMMDDQLEVANAPSKATAGKASTNAAPISFDDDDIPF